MSKLDYLIVGAGPYGATFARLASDAGKTCRVIDRRPHLAGNCYTKQIEGIDVHMYGPHVFHTDSDEIWRFVNQFTDWLPFRNNPRVRIGDRMFSFPINLLTLHQLWGVTTPSEAAAKLRQVRIPHEHPKNAEEWLLSEVGPEIYELFFRGYTKKQWGRNPRQLPASIVQRLPFRLTYNDDYYSVRHQGIPSEGYTQLFAEMLCGIPVDLDVSLESLDWKRYAKQLVYTGPIDQFFGREHGQLQYRALRFEMKIVDGDFQGHAIVNYPEESVPFVRIVEHQHFAGSRIKRLNGRSAKKSVITFDHPVYGNEAKEITDPQYPIRDVENVARYERYKDLAKKSPEVIFGGRLAEYRYYDMDQAIGAAMSTARRELIRARTTRIVPAPTYSLPKPACSSYRPEGTNRRLEELLLVYAVAHNAERFDQIATVPWIEKLRLDQLAIPSEFRGEQLAEARAFLDESLDFGGREYCGFINARWNEKYHLNCGRNFRAPRVIRQQDFPLLSSELAPNVVLAPDVALRTHGVTGWLSMMEWSFPGVGRYLSELEGIGVLSLKGNCPSIWNNNFVCRQDVMRDFLTTWRTAFRQLWNRYKFEIDIYVPANQAHRRFAYLAECITLMYFANRPDLQVRRFPIIENRRIRRSLRRPILSRGGLFS